MVVLVDGVDLKGLKEREEEWEWGLEKGVDVRVLDSVMRV